MKTQADTGIGSFAQAYALAGPTGHGDLCIDPAAIFHHLKLMQDCAEEAFIYRRRIEWLREFGVPSPNFPSPPKHHHRTHLEWEVVRNLEIFRLATAREGQVNQ